MEIIDNLLNVFLIIGILIIIYITIQKYKIKQPENTNNQNMEKFNMDKIFYNEPIKNTNIKFNYEMNDTDKKFLNEQENGVNLNTYYPNTWIEKIDEFGKPIYNSRENTTGKADTMINTGTSISYEFNKLKIDNMDGAINPDDIKNGSGKTLKEVYDGAFVNYKNLVPKKTLIDKKSELNYSNGASNLTFIKPDDWVYEDEKPENGGEILNGLFAVDMDTLNSVAIF